MAPWLTSERTCLSAASFKASSSGRRLGQQAQSRGVTGWVRNLDDDRVEAVFEGEENDVKALVDFCRNGPRGAVVTGVNVAYEVFSGEFRDFRVAY